MMYRKQESGFETSQIGDFIDSHACDVWRNTLLVIVSCTSFIKNAYHAILAHNGNQQAVNPKDELRKGRVFTKIFGHIFVIQRRTDLASSLFAVKYTVIVRRA
jgi:hypothetical protein